MRFVCISRILFENPTISSEFILGKFLFTLFVSNNQVLNFCPLFLIEKFLLLKEDRISSTKSVIPKDFKSLSTLLFLLTGDDFADFPALETDKDRVKRTRGAKEQVQKEMQRIFKRRIELLEKLASDDTQAVIQNWDSLLARFTFEEQQLKTKNLQVNTIQKQNEENKLLERVFSKYQEVTSEIEALEGELQMHRNSRSMATKFCSTMNSA